MDMFDATCFVSTVKRGVKHLSHTYRGTHIYIYIECVVIRYALYFLCDRHGDNLSPQNDHHIKPHTFSSYVYIVPFIFEISEKGVRGLWFLPIRAKLKSECHAVLHTQQRGLHICINIYSFSGGQCLSNAFVINPFLRM